MKPIKRFSDELVKGSLILLISMNIFNFLNYVFHFLSARLLGIVDYGILATLMSIVYLFNIPSETIQTITSRYSTKFNVNREDRRIKNLLVKSIRKFMVLGVLGFVIFAGFSPLIGGFLSIDSKLILLTGAILIVIFLVPITRGILQGTKKFTGLGMSYFSESFVKIILTIFLILIGLEVYGAIGAVLIGIFAGFVVSFIPLREVLKVKRENEKIKGIYSYSVPVLISIAGVTFLYSIDIILAKRFFPAEIVGGYAVISMLSKMIFFGTFPISKAMFPVASERHDKKGASSGILKKSLLIVSLLSGSALLVYFLIPKSIIRILFGMNYISMSLILIYPAMAMAILSLTNVFILYNLCVNKYKRNYLVIFFVFLQVVLLFLFHSSLFQFVSMLILCNVLLFIAFAVLNLKK